MTERILSRLMPGNPVSGQALSEELGVTRAAIWKQIEQLRAQGFDIESLGRQGYRLRACPDSLMPPVVGYGLHTAWAGKPTIFLRSVDSTNRYARSIIAQGATHGTLVLADEQTAGRGRRGRSWLSPAGEGVFLSLIVQPQAHPAQVAALSMRTALAAAQAIEAVSGLDARIKWPNDIVCGGKKVCGMLLEMNADEQTVYDVTIGVGFNVHQKAFDAELSATASSLDLLSGQTVSRAALVRAFLEAFEAVYAQDAADMMADYRARSATLGREVRVIGTQETFTGTAEAVDESGALCVRDEAGALRRVLAGDVSVRGLMDYV